MNPRVGSRRKHAGDVFILEILLTEFCQKGSMVSGGWYNWKFCQKGPMVACRNVFVIGVNGSFTDMF